MMTDRISSRKEHRKTYEWRTWPVVKNQYGSNRLSEHTFALVSYADDNVHIRLLFSCVQSQQKSINWMAISSERSVDQSFFTIDVRDDF